MVAHAAPETSTFGNLTRGAYAGRESRLYYDQLAPQGYTEDSLSDEAAEWVDIVRFRNLQTSDGPPLTPVDFHGGTFSTNVSGYDAFSGSFELVRRRGTDPIYNFLRAAKVAKDIVRLCYLNDLLSVAGATGWIAPVLLGEFSETSNGNDPVVVTIPFALADAFDELGAAEYKYDVTVATGGTNPTDPS